MDSDSSRSSEELEILLESSDGDSDPRRSSLAIGCVISDKILSITGVLAQLRNCWSEVEAPSIKSFGGNLYGIYFANGRCLESALDEAPFIVSKCVFHIQRWTAGLAYDEIDFSMVPFWVQIYKLPLDLLSLRNARTIGAKLGVLLRVEDPFEDEVGRGFLRVRVLIDVKKPLVEFFWIPRSDGTRTKAFLRYEKLQNYCYSCGKLGNIAKSCAAIVKPSDKEMRYETDLRAPAIRYSMTVRRSEIGINTEQRRNSIKIDTGKAMASGGREIEVEIPLHVQQNSTGIKASSEPVVLEKGEASSGGEEQSEKPVVRREDMAAVERMRADILVEEN